MHQVDFWVALGGTGGLVDVVSAEVAAELKGLVDGDMGEVLITEGYRKQSQLKAEKTLFWMITYQRPSFEQRTEQAGLCLLWSTGSAGCRSLHSR